jgi:hypothetical protein
MPGRNPDGWLDELKAEWLRITGNGQNLHLTPVYRRSKRGRRLDDRVNLKAIKELVKYVTKAASFSTSPERVCEFLRAFKHLRRVQCFGSFQGVLKDSEREPGDDGRELECSCGKCHYHDEFTWAHRPVHISETKAMPDGTRQLKWDFWSEVMGSVEESPPDLVLTSPVIVHAVQESIEFPGALPGEAGRHPSLFAGAA